MLKGLCAAACLAVIGAAGPAFAQGAPAQAGGTIAGVTAEKFAKVLQDAGFRAEIVRGDKRPYIRTGLSGRRAAVYFYDCKDNTCGSFQYSVIFNKDAKYTIDFSNTWNTKRRYSKTYLDSDGDMNLEWDVDLDGGVTDEFLKRTALSFERMISDFDKFTP